MYLITFTVSLLTFVIPNISTFFSCPGMNRLPYFIAFLRSWTCPCLFHLSLPYLRLRSPDTLHTSDRLLLHSNSSLSSAFSSVFSSCEESPGVAFELRAEPILPPALQVAFLNRGNVRSDICSSLLHSCFSKNVPWLRARNNETQKAGATPSNTKVG